MPICASAPDAPASEFGRSTPATTTSSTSTASRAPTGCASFLESRGIELPEGTADDPPDAETVDGLGNRKNEIVLQADRRAGRRGLHGLGPLRRSAARDAGLRRAVVSSSANAAQVLEAAGIDDLFEARRRRRTSPSEEDLRGQARSGHVPGRGAQSSASSPSTAAVFEDALAGVEAGRAGDFGYVVGVDRVGQRAALREHGADVVVDDLAELLDV